MFMKIVGKICLAAAAGGFFLIDPTLSYPIVPKIFYVLFLLLISDNFLKARDEYISIIVSKIYKDKSVY